MKNIKNRSCYQSQKGCHMERCPTRNWRWGRWQIALRIAAAIILFFSILAAGYFHLKINKQRDLSASQTYLKKDHASVYILNDSQQGPMAMVDVSMVQYGIKVDRSVTLIFQHSDPVLESSMQSDLVIMSNQAQVQCVILEDGSKVWHNSNSTLTLPRHFKGLNRSVV